MMTFRCFFYGKVVLIFFSFFPDDSARFDVFSVCLPEKLTNHTE